LTTPTEPRQGFQGAYLPVPGNAEFLLWLCVEIVFVIIWAASDYVNAHDFVVATMWLSGAYLISRGIAKATRVLEH
jgi:nicotinamide riboside transporter PnuC